MRPSTAEQSVARYGLERGYFTQQQLASAEARASGQPGALLQHLAQHLDPTQRAELTQVYQQAQAAGETIAGLPAGATPTPAEATVCGPPEPVAAGFGASPVPSPLPALTASAERSTTRGTPKRVADYEVVRELGRGGMGVVLEARSLKLDRKVALKLLLDGGANQAIDVARFQIEAKAAARLNHRHIVRLFDHGRDEQDRWYMVLELVEGESLYDHISDKGPLAPQRAAEIARDLASAIQYAHEESVLHRDLKPQNVMLDAEGAARLTDFGLAKLVGDAAASLTATGHAMGTPAFMAPEQAEGAKDRLDERTDVYGLGATLYYMLAGQPPFTAPSIQALYLAVLDEPPAPLRSVVDGVDRDLERICQKCLEKHPEDRYADAGALQADLNRYLQGRTVAAGPPRPKARLARWIGRHALLLTVCVFLLILVVVIAVAWSAVRTAELEKEAALARLARAPGPTPTQTQTPNQTESVRKTESKPPPKKTEPKPAEREKRFPMKSIRWKRPAVGGVREMRRFGPWRVWYEFKVDASRWIAQRGDGRPLVGPDLEQVCWDAPRRRVLGVRGLSDRKRAVVAWKPGAPPRELLQVAGVTTSLASGADLLLIGVGFELRAFALPNPTKPRWTLPLGSRLFAPPLFLDLDGDGRREHALICTSNARAILVRLSDGTPVAKASLPGPVIHTPQPLGPVTSGRLAVLAPCSDGRLARLELSATQLRVVRTLDVGGPLVGAPAVARDRNGRAQQILVPQRWVELLAVDPDRLSVRWAGWLSPRQHSRGPVALVDLDRDGREEVAVGLFAPGTPSRIALYTLDGERLGELPATEGVAPILLGGSGPILVCGGEQVVAWGPWQRLPAKQPRPEGWAEAQLLGGAWERASEGAKLLSGLEGEVVAALASWHRGDRSLAKALRRRDRKAAFRVVEGMARKFAPPMARNRLLKRFGRPGNKPAMRPQRARRWRRAPDSLAALRLDKRAPKAHNLSLRVGGLVGGPGNQPYLTTGARIEVTFRLAERHQATLELEHKAIRAYNLGNACVRVLLDGKQVDHRWAPSRPETARIPLGLLTAKEHRIQLEVDRSLTLYRLFELRIVAK